MGSCSCIQKTEYGDLNIDPERMKKLSIFKLIDLGNSIKTDIKMLDMLKRLQARVKGIYIRQKIKATGKVKSHLATETYLKYTTVANNRIVFLLLI